MISKEEIIDGEILILKYLQRESVTLTKGLSIITGTPIEDLKHWMNEGWTPMYTFIDNKHLLFEILLQIVASNRSEFSLNAPGYLSGDDSDKWYFSMLSDQKNGHTVIHADPAMAMFIGIIKYLKHPIT